MTSLANINFFGLIFLNIIGGIIVYFIYSASTKKKAIANFLFLLAVMLMVIWTDFNYLGDIVSHPSLALVLKKIYFALVGIFFIFIYLFTIYFPLISEKRNIFFEKFTIFIWILNSFLILFTNIIIKNVERKEWGFNIVNGDGIIFFYLFVTFYVFLVLYELIKKYFRISQENKRKVLYFIIGIATYGVFQLTFNVFIPLILQTKKYWQFGDYSAIFFFSLTAYAIVRRNLFGIKVVLTTLFVGLIAILLFLDTFLLTEDLILKTLKGIIFIFFLFFGYYLIRATQEEERRREEAERLAAQERALREEAERVAIRESALRKKMERLNQARQQFLLSSQHYFRTPLTAIMGFLELALENKLSKSIPAEVEKWLRGARKGTEELKKRIEESLEISRMEAGKGILEIKEVQLEEVIKGIIKEVKAEAEFKKLPLIFEKPKTLLPKVKVDETKIREALSNIITNAIKHTPAGKIVIKLEEVKGGRAILFSVKDTGIGMPEEELSHVGTTPFERGKGGQKLSPLGKGIGLYLSRLIIEAHGGKLWAESEGVDKGSTFFVELHYEKNIIN